MFHSRPAPPQPQKDTTVSANLLYLRLNIPLWHPLLNEYTPLAKWIVATPSIGIEYSPVSKLGIVVNATMAPWDLDEKQWRLWQIAPQVRYYLGADLRMYAGLEYSVGQYCVANTNGEQGDYWSGGLAAGYQFSLTRSLLLDLGMTVGYMEFYNKQYFTYNEGYHYKTYPALKDYGWWIGPTTVSVSLVYQLF